MLRLYGIYCDKNVDKGNILIKYNVIKFTNCTCDISLKYCMLIFGCRRSLNTPCSPCREIEFCHAFGFFFINKIVEKKFDFGQKSVFKIYRKINFKKSSLRHMSLSSHYPYNPYINLSNISKFFVVRCVHIDLTSPCYSVARKIIKYLPAFCKPGDNLVTSNMHVNASFTNGNKNKTKINAQI